MLAKFRSVISSFDREPLRGRVEVDEAFVGGPRQGKRGRGADGKVGVAGAVEVGATGWGRCRIGVIPDATGPSLQAFVAANIEPGSTVVTDGHGGYRPALAGYYHEPFSVHKSGRPAHEALPAVHRLFALFKNMLAGAYTAGASAQHMAAYADEFVFRFNRRHSRKRGLLFMRLGQRAVAAQPVRYRDLARISRSKQARPPGVPGPRRAPGSLAAEPANRPWLAAPPGPSR